MKFELLYVRVLRLMGYEPATWTGSAAQQEEVADAIGRATRTVWQATMWSRLMELAEAAVTTDGDGARYVPWGTGVDTGDAVRSVHKRNPRAVRNDALMEFLFSSRGVELSFLAGDSVWIEYRPKVPVFTRVAYGAGNSYVVGDVVLHEGDCWLALADVTGVTPAVGVAQWRRQAVPEWMADAVVRGAFSDLLRNDGRGDRADVEEARFNAEILRLVTEQEAQQGQHRRITV